MSDWRPDLFLLVRVDGTTEPIEVGYESIRTAIDNWIDFITVTKDVGFFIDDEGMLRNQPLNIPVSLMAGRAIYGPAVMTRGLPDDDGDSVPPPKTAVSYIQAVAHLWSHVVAGAADVGQDPYSYPDAATIPPPEFIELPCDWFDEH